MRSERERGRNGQSGREAFRTMRSRRSSFCSYLSPEKILEKPQIFIHPDNLQQQIRDQKKLETVVRMIKPHDS